MKCAYPGELKSLISVLGYLKNPELRLMINLFHSVYIAGYREGKLFAVLRPTSQTRARVDED